MGKIWFLNDWIICLLIILYVQYSYLEISNNVEKPVHFYMVHIKLSPKTEIQLMLYGTYTRFFFFSTSSCTCVYRTHIWFSLKGAFLVPPIKEQFQFCYLCWSWCLGAIVKVHFLITQWKVAVAIRITLLYVRFVSKSNHSSLP